MPLHILEDTSIRNPRKALVEEAQEALNETRATSIWARANDHLGRRRDCSLSGASGTRDLGQYRSRRYRDFSVFRLYKITGNRDILMPKGPRERHPTNPKEKNKTEELVQFTNTRLSPKDVFRLRKSPEGQSGYCRWEKFVPQ